MRALTWHGRRDGRVEHRLRPHHRGAVGGRRPRHSSGVCGSDLHLYEVLGPFIDEGDVSATGRMGIVEAVGSEVPDLAVATGSPSRFSCGHCSTCDQHL